MRVVGRKLVSSVTEFVLVFVQGLVYFLLLFLFKMAGYLPELIDFITDTAFGLLPSPVLLMCTHPFWMSKETFHLSVRCEQGAPGQSQIDLAVCAPTGISPDCFLR